MLSYFKKRRSRNDKRCKSKWIKCDMRSTTSFILNDENVIDLDPNFRTVKPIFTDEDKSSMII